jgi:hypothetical protein
MTVQDIAMDAYRLCRLYGSSTAILSLFQACKSKTSWMLILADDDASLKTSRWPPGEMTWRY